MSEAFVRPKGRVKSCTSCRQVKLRCDAVTSFPAACSRCKAHGLDCRIDSNFKRVSVRGRLEEMSRKVNSLQNTNSPRVGQSLSASSSLLVPGPTTNSSTASFPGGDWLLLSDHEINQSKQWTLGQVVLGYQETSEILHFYANNYHDHAPILDPLASISYLYDSNQLLFWTIVRVASYRHYKFSHVFDLSIEPYQELLMNSLVFKIHDYRSIQALIILCHWPNCGPKQSVDPSWQYCGLALNAAMQMGLHQSQPEKLVPGFHGRSNVHQISAYCRHMIWLSCFNISTSLSVWLGLPPQLSSPAQLNVISATAREPDVPRQYMVQIEIQQQVVQHSTTLTGDVDATTVTTLLNLFNNELDKLFNLYQEIWTTRLEIHLLGAKLYLFSLCLTLASKRRRLMNETARPYTLDSARLPVQLGLPSAISLIHNIASLNKDQTSEMMHYPKFYFQLVVFAVAFLIKFLGGNPEAAQEDRELAISHITLAHQLFTSFPIGEDFARVAQMIEMLVKNLSEEKTHESDPIRTRSGASLLYDVLQKFGSTSDRVLPDNNMPAVRYSDVPAQSVLERDLAIGTAATVPADPNSFWSSAETYSDLSISQAEIDAGLDSMQWMSDDMLLEIFRM